MRDSLIEGETHSKPKNKYLVNAFWLILGAGIATGIILGVKSKSSDDNTCPSGPSLPAYNPDEYDRLDAFYNKTETHSFTQADNVRTDRVGAAVPNPAYPRLIAYTRTQYYLPDANASTTTLWITILSNDFHSMNLTSRAFQLTQPRWGVNDNSPAWSKDGKHLLFLSNRDNNGTQLYQLTMPSSLYTDYTPLNDVLTSTRAITNFPISIDNFLWSATNDVAAISVQVYPKMDMYQTVAYQQNITDSHVEGQLYDKLYVRHWDEWFQCRPSIGCLRNHPHLLSLTLENGDYKVHDVRDILAGIDSDSPTRPFGGVEQWSFNSRGRIFAFTRQQTGAGEDTSVAWNTDLNIHTIIFDIVNNTFTLFPIVCHTCDKIGAEDTNPSFAPGWNQPNTLAYLAMTRPQYESDRLRVRLFNDITNRTGTYKELTANWDLSVSSLIWSAPINGTSLYMYLGVEESARDVLYVLNLKTKTQPTKFPISGMARGAISAHAVSADGAYLVHTWSSMQSPACLQFVSLQLYYPITITQHNEKWLHKVLLTSQEHTEYFSFPCSNNDTCWGWIMRPVGFDATKSYPMAFLIHGGPQGAWTDSWSYRWNPQAYTGAGFVAVMINPHGSTGYGQNFTDDIIGRYGSWPFADLTQYGLPHVLKAYPFINASRVVALGASYGGYMINWIAGQPEAKNFSALVTHDGMFDIRAFYYQTEEVYFPEHDNGGIPPFKNATAYEEWSPINHVDKWTQPMFVIHGGHDYRIPEAQGISVFTATQRLGIQGCKFLYFPKENHWVLKPANSIFWHNEVIDFIKIHTKL